MTATRPEIRSAPARVDAEWLTDVLRFAGHDVRVGDFRARNVGTGQVGQNVRFELDYSAGTGPASVVGKFASDDPESRRTGIELSNYLREVRFYNDLRPTLDIRVPGLIFADIDEPTHDFVLVMEDLAPAEQGDQLAGCGADEARLALEELARLHGPRWNDATLLAVDWLGGADPTGPETTRALWAHTWPAFRERYAHRLDGDELSVAGGLHERFAQYTTRREGPFTVTHGDYRLDNMLFGGPAPLTVVDWQSPGIGPGAPDAAYFMGTGLEAPERRACERELVARYHEVLAGYDIGDYDLERCWEDYRRAAFGGLVMAVIASMIVGQTERGDDMFMTMYRRSAAMAMDLDALALLDRPAA